MWNVDVLVWSQFVLLDVITIGTVLTLCESRPTRKQAIIGTLSVLATAAIISADNIAIIGAGYTVVLGCATMRCTHGNRCPPSMNTSSQLVT